MQHLAAIKNPLVLWLGMPISQDMDMQADQGGTIDPYLFVDDDDSKWLLSKNDGNAVGKPTFISICLLSPDGLQVQRRA